MMSFSCNATVMVCLGSRGNLREGPGTAADRRPTQPSASADRLRIVQVEAGSTRRPGTTGPRLKEDGVGETLLEG